MEEIGQSSYGVDRLYLQAVDKAFGETGVVIHFLDKNDYSKFEALSGSNILVNNDFKRENYKTTCIKVDTTGVETEYTYTGELQTVNSGATLNHNEATLVYSDNKFTNAGTAIKFEIV